MEYLQSGIKAAKGAYKTAKYQMEGLSEIEIKTRECTNSDPWGAHGKDLAVLARATNHREDMYLIMKMLWQRLEEREEKWRHCYKALNVIEYLIAHGHESVLKELKQNIRYIEYLDTFRFKDSSGRDQGVNVRQKSAALVLILKDDEQITERREKARANKGKYGGISAEDVRSGSYRGGQGDSYSSRDTYSSRDNHSSRDTYSSRDTDDYSSRDRFEQKTAENSNQGDHEFRSFSNAPQAPPQPVRQVPVPLQPQQQQFANFGDFEDDTAAMQQGGYVPKVVMSPAPAVAPVGRVVPLAPPPDAGVSAQQPAPSGGGLDALFAGMSTQSAPVAQPAQAPVSDPFGDLTAAPVAPAAPATTSSTSVDLFSLDVPAPAAPPAMGGRGGLGGGLSGLGPQMGAMPQPPMGGAIGGMMMGGQQMPGMFAQQPGIYPQLQQQQMMMQQQHMMVQQAMQGMQGMPGMQMGAQYGTMGGNQMAPQMGGQMFGGPQMGMNVPQMQRAPTGNPMGFPSSGLSPSGQSKMGYNRGVSGGADTLNGLTADLFGNSGGASAPMNGGGGGSLI